YGLTGIAEPTFQDPYCIRKHHGADISGIVSGTSIQKRPYFGDLSVVIARHDSHDDVRIQADQSSSPSGMPSCHSRWMRSSSAATASMIASSISSTDNALPDGGGS